MSEAVSNRRPTLRQQRLAVEIENPANTSKMAALLAAGYSPATARGMATPTLERVGAQTAIAKREARALDKARGLKALSDRALDKPELVDELDARDRLAFGIQAAKAAAEIGVVDEPGDGDAHRMAQRRRLARSWSLIVRMHTTGIGPLGWRAPQHLVLSPRGNAPNQE